MKKIIVDKSKCPANHPCPLVMLCPSGAITQKGNDAPDFDEEKCTKCMVCTKNCAYGVFEEREE